ncbi:MAG: DUF3180 domain-containing protein [Mycobacteriaceae bacterium]
MTTTRMGDLSAIALIVGIASLMFTAGNYESIPPIHWYTGISLAVVAIAEAVLAFVIKARIRDSHIGEGSGRMHPLSVARAVALAKASSLLGAILVGLWGGFLLYLFVASGDLAAARGDIPGSLVGAVSSMTLVGAALWLEHCCKAPKDPNPQPS